MSSRILWSSDHHFGHRAILDERMSIRRPFASIEAHDEALIANWNAAVGPDDIVWYLGDFCYRCSEDYARSVFGRLRGKRRFLVRGNHDRIGARLPWDGVFDVARVVVPGPDGVPQGVWMSHYAHRVWPRMHPWRPALLWALARHAAGHCHQHRRRGRLLRFPPRYPRRDPRPPCRERPGPASGVCGFELRSSRPAEGTVIRHTRNRVHRHRRSRRRPPSWRPPHLLRSAFAQHRGPARLGIVGSP